MSMKKINLVLLFLLLGNSVAWSAEESTWDNAALTALLTKVPNVESALNTIAQSLNYLDTTYILTHVDDEGNPYATDDLKQDVNLRLINFEIRLAAMEETAGSFCLSEQECAANCPKANTLTAYTCGPDCKKAHRLALISTLEPASRIKDLANRLLAVAPLLNTTTPPASLSNCSGGATPSTTPTEPKKGETTGLFNGG